MEHDQIEEKQIDSTSNADEQAGDDFDKEDLQCRFYRNEWPNTEELVVVDINDVQETGAYLRLLEYNNKQGYILSSNTTRKRVKNVRKLLRVGTQDYMQVIGVDKENGYIDLSKKIVQLQDVEALKTEFNKAKIVHLIMKFTAFALHCKLIELYEAFGWDLYDKFDHAYDAFKLCLTDPELVFSKVTITEEQKKALMASINKKMAAAPQKLRTTFNLHCYTYEGIEAIKESLLAARAECSDDKFKMVFQMIAPPEYKAEVVSLDKPGATERLEKALEIVQREIKARGGQFKLVQGVTRIGTRIDDVDNDKIIDNMNRNEDNEGSQDSSEEDEGEGIDVDLDGDDIQDEDN